MQWVGRALSSVSQYYKEINPATLTGAIDVIVVSNPKVPKVPKEGEDPNDKEELACSPFHVRFGKLSVLRPVDRKVRVTVNDELCEFYMKVFETGEAFFVFETDDDVPEDILTSPVLSASGDAVDSGAESGNETDTEDEEEKSVRRKKREVEPLDLNEQSSHSTKEESSHQSDTETSAAETSSPNPRSTTTGLTSRDITPFSPDDAESKKEMSHSEMRDQVTRGDTFEEGEHDISEGDRKPKRREGSQSSVLSPSNLLSGHGGATLGMIATGGASAAKQLEKAGKAIVGIRSRGKGVGDVEHHPNGDREELTEDGEEREEGMGKEKRGEEPEKPEAGDGGMAYEDRENRRSSRAARKKPTAFSLDDGVDEDDQLEDSTRRFSVADRADLAHLASRRSSSAPPHHSRDGTDHTLTQEQFDELHSAEAGSLAVNDSSSSLNFGLTRTESALMLDTEGYKTAPRHNMKVDPTEPKGFESSMQVANTELGGDPKLLQFTRALLNFAMKAEEVADSGTSTRPTLATSTSPTSSMPARSRSASVTQDPFQFCLIAGDGSEFIFELGLLGDKELENEYARISFTEFLDQPNLIDDRRLVLQYDGRSLTWDNASTIMASLAVYRSSLLELPEMARKQSKEEAPQSQEAAPRQRTWTRWWRTKPSNSKTQPGLSPRSDTSAPTSPKSLPVAEEEEGDPTTPPFRATSEPPPDVTPTISPQAATKHYVKTLRLTSDQLKQLKLKPGSNTITFSVRSSYSQGNAVCSAKIFLWPHDSHIVVSDIDGTITKYPHSPLFNRSDALGHVLTMIGRDWTHAGVAKLYTDIVSNGYRIMYLTSRAIGQADTTREYLRGISQGNIPLPAGPVIMSPDRLVTSLHRIIVIREVILRKPEVFKMACLRDIQRLFKDRKPFYAGFGNRITDALSYRSVDVPSSKIFTIDSTGDVKMELLALAGYKSTYIHMTDLVDQMFPPIAKRETNYEFSDLNFWRTPPPSIDLPPELDIQSPPSPALSARSDSRLSYIRIPGIGLGRSDSKASTKTAEPTLERRRSRTTPSSPHLSAIISEQTDIPYSPLPIPEHPHDMHSGTDSMPGSLPGSPDDDDHYVRSLTDAQKYRKNIMGEGEPEEADEGEEEEEEEEEEEIPPDEDIEAEDMDFSSVPYL
ncbi:LNS2-domain-containing protein [Atractiella rhizophila]|nr:LNS2-domain-containing protein [Atractiella rhizophila]